MLAEDPALQELKQLLKNSCFYRQSGRELCSRGEKLVRSVYSRPDEAYERIREVSGLCREIRMAREESYAALCNPLPDYDEVTCIAADREDGILEALEAAAAVSAFLIAKYRNPEALQGLSWAPNAGMSERLHGVNQVFLPALRQANPPELGWIISWDRPAGGFLGGIPYSICYVRHEELKSRCMGGKILKMPGGYSLNAACVPGQSLCWGIGNLISLAPGRGLELLRGGIADKLKRPEQAQYCRPVPGPDRVMSILSGGREYCIAPEDLLTAMNLWAQGYEYLQRKAQGRCLLCGKTVGSLFCPSHYRR